MKQLFTTVGVDEARIDGVTQEITNYFDRLPECVYKITRENGYTYYTDDIHLEIWHVFESMAIKEGVTIHEGYGIIITGYYGDFSETVYIHPYGTELDRMDLADDLVKLAEDIGTLDYLGSDEIDFIRQQTLTQIESDEMDDLKQQLQDLYDDDDIANDETYDRIGCLIYRISVINQNIHRS